MSRIIKLRIRNLFGITEYSSNGKSVELCGKNGAGKTSVIDSIKLALKNKSPRDFIIKDGASEGEVFIETDAGISVNRKVRTGKADYKSIKQNGEEVQNPESFLREIFTELQLNPVEFIAMDSKEQNRIVLDMIDFKWDLNWIREQFGEIVPGVNYEQNILCVLRDIQSEEGYYFRTRQDLNREARNKKAFIDEIGSSLPKDYNAAFWESVNLSQLYKKIEGIRHVNKRIEDARNIMKNQDAKIRSFQADRDIEIASLEKEITFERSNIEKEIERLKAQITALETRKGNLEEIKSHKVKAIEQTYKANVAQYETLVSEHQEWASKSPENASVLCEEAQTAETMKSHINEYHRMVELQKDVERLTAASENFTGLIEKARLLPGEILKECKLPIEGLTIEDGKPLINGLPINNLSDGEKLSLCVQVATQKENSLNLLLIDGVEKLSTQNRASLYEQCKAKGVQFIATRTTDDEDLTVLEIA